jgi:hypothetical protein
MAISWILRQRIRIKPNVIFELDSRQLNQDVFEFALKQEYSDFSALINKFCNNRDFLNAFLNSKLLHEYGSDLIYPFWDNIPEDMKGQVIDKLIERDINVKRIPNEIWIKFPQLVIHKLRKTNNEFYWLYLTGDTNSIKNYSDHQIAEIYIILKEKGVNIKSFASGWHMSKNNPLQYSKELMKLFLQDDYSGAINSLTDLYLQNQPILLSAIKECFLENLDETLHCYKKIQKIFGYSSTVFTEGENDKIAERIAQITTEVDIKNNKELYADFITREKFLKRDSLIKKVFERNLYIVDYLARCDIYVNEDMLPEEIDENYIPSLETSEVMFNARPKLLIRGLEKNFEQMIRYRRRIDIAKFELNDFRRIYEIAKENGYTLNEDSPEFITNNPYFYLEKVKRGDFDRINPKTEKNIPFYRQVVLYSNSIGY